MRKVSRFLSLFGYVEVNIVKKNCEIVGYRLLFQIRPVSQSSRFAIPTQIEEYRKKEITFIKVTKLIILCTSHKNSVAENKIKKSFTFLFEIFKNSN